MYMYIPALLPGAGCPAGGRGAGGGRHRALCLRGGLPLSQRGWRGAVRGSRGGGGPLQGGLRLPLPDVRNVYV